MSFVTVDHGFEISLPTGTRTTRQLDRLFNEMSYTPGSHERGLVIDGPVWSEGVTMKLWMVHVGGSNWWFSEDQLISI